MNSFEHPINHEKMSAELKLLIQEVEDAENEIKEAATKLTEQKQKSLLHITKKMMEHLLNNANSFFSTPPNKKNNRVYNATLSSILLAAGLGVVKTGYDLFTEDDFEPLSPDISLRMPSTQIATLPEQPNSPIVDDTLTKEIPTENPTKNTNEEQTKQAIESYLEDMKDSFNENKDEDDFDDEYEEPSPPKNSVDYTEMIKNTNEIQLVLPRAVDDNLPKDQIMNLAYDYLQDIAVNADKNSHSYKVIPFKMLLAVNSINSMSHQEVEMIPDRLAGEHDYPFYDAYNLLHPYDQEKVKGLLAETAHDSISDDIINIWGANYVIGTIQRGDADSITMMEYWLQDRIADIQSHLTFLKTVDVKLFEEDKKATWEELQNIKLALDKTGLKLPTINIHEYLSTFEL